MKSYTSLKKIAIVYKVLYYFIKTDEISNIESIIYIYLRIENPQNAAMFTTLLLK